MTWVASRRRPTRDGILIGVGSLILFSQAVAWTVQNRVEPAFITAGTSILLSPLLLHKDEQRQSKDQHQLFLEELKEWLEAERKRERDSGPEP